MSKAFSILAVLALLLPCTPAVAEQMWTAPGAEGFGYGEDSGTGAYLGVDINDVTSDRLSALKLKEEHGVEITMVDQDSPAGKAGLKEHDVILSLNGTTVESGAQLRRMIHETPPGRVVTLNISRDGQPMSIQAQLADRRKTMSAKNWPAMPAVPAVPAVPAMPSMPEFEFPGVVVVHSSARSGVMVENLTPQLGEFFGVKGGGGVLVRSVEKGSRAEKAGLKAGDVIVKVSGEKVSDVGDFSRALRNHKGDSAAIGVVRDKREQTLNLPLPERKQSELEQEETFEFPEINAEVEMKLADVETKLAKVRPQVEAAMAKAQVQLEKTQKDLCKKAQEFKKQQLDSKKMQKQVEKAMHDAERNLELHFEFNVDDDNMI
jgi:serine protease Do